MNAADLAHLREALALAERGRFAVEPNPTVGCVVVRGGRVVARGWHRAWGGPHAEVEALRMAGRRARGATVYTSLEPCSTSGKTGPCTAALAAARVARVVWAASDPNPVHRGRARRILAAAGVRAEGPALPREGGRLVAPFRAALGRDRPWVILKWAASLDGRISEARGAGGSLSSGRAWAWVHETRGRVEAVAVGVGTVLVDDSRLTCRRPGGPPHGRPQPTAVVFDSNLRTPLSARILSQGRPVLLYAARAPRARERALARLPGVTVVRAPGRDGRVDLAAALADLHARGVRRLLVEGGAGISGPLVAQGLVDQVAVLFAPLLLGGPAPVALEGADTAGIPGAPRLDPLRVRRLGGDVVVEGYLRRGRRGPRDTSRRATARRPAGGCSGR